MALTKVTGQVINDSTGLVVGVTTVGGGLSATDGFFSGIVTAVGDASFSGNVSVGGTLTYEDVTNIDAVGLVTARNGIVVGSGITLSKDGDGFFTGVVTATSYAGDGSGLTGIAATDNVRTGILDVAGVGTFRNDVNIPDKIIHLGDTDTAIRFPAVDTVSVETGGTERIRVGPSGQIGIAGANYGTSGQVLKSQGSGSAVQWASVGVSTSSLQVLEQFYLLCDGRSVSTSNGTVTTTNVTTDPNLTDDFAEASGSSLTYHPPTGTTEIIYEYKFLIAENNSNDRYLVGYYVDIDGSEILESRSSRMGSAEYQDTIDVKYGFRVNTGGSNNATTGDRAALTSMTIKTMVRRWASSYAAKLHFLQYYSGTSAVSIVRRPYVGITAIGSLS